MNATAGSAYPAKAGTAPAAICPIAVASAPSPASRRSCRNTSTVTPGAPTAIGRSASPRLALTPQCGCPVMLLATACGMWNSVSAATSSSSGAITLTTARASLQRWSRTVQESQRVRRMRFSAIRPRIRSAPLMRSATSAACWPERTAQATGFGAGTGASPSAASSTPTISSACSRRWSLGYRASSRR